MNWAQFIDPASHMCLTGAVVALWSLTQEVAGLSPFTEFIDFKIEEKLQCLSVTSVTDVMLLPCKVIHIFFNPGSITKY